MAESFPVRLHETSDDDFGQETPTISLKNNKTVKSQHKIVDHRIYDQDERRNHQNGQISQRLSNSGDHDEINGVACVEGGRVSKDPNEDCLVFSFNEGPTCTHENGSDLEVHREDKVTSSIQFKKHGQKTSSSRTSRVSKPAARTNDEDQSLEKMLPKSSDIKNGLDIQNRCRGQKTSSSRTSRVPKSAARTKFGDLEDQKGNLLGSVRGNDERSYLCGILCGLWGNDERSYLCGILCGLWAKWKSLTWPKKIAVTIVCAILIFGCVGGLVGYHLSNQSDEGNSSSGNTPRCQIKSADLEKICQNMTSIKIEQFEHFGNDSEKCTLTLHQKKLSENEFWSCVPEKNCVSWWLTNTKKDPTKTTCRCCCPIVTFEDVSERIKFAPHNSQQCEVKSEKTTSRCFSYP